MYETMVAADGVGLAAPQIGEAVRVAIVDMGEGQEVIEMVNPVVTAIGGSEVEVEGCLSFPGLYGEVERPFFVRLKHRSEMVHFMNLKRRIMKHVPFFMKSII